MNNKELTLALFDRLADGKPIGGEHTEGVVRHLGKIDKGRTVAMRIAAQNAGLAEPTRLPSRAEAFVDLEVEPEASSITTTQIKAIREDAIRAGDPVIISVCDKALRGVRWAVAECQRDIDSALDRKAAP